MGHEHYLWVGVTPIRVALLCACIEGDGGGCSPPFMLSCCMLMFAVSGMVWGMVWVVSPHSVVLLFRVIVVVSAGGSAHRQAKMVRLGMLVVMCSGS